MQKHERHLGEIRSLMPPRKQDTADKNRRSVTMSATQDILRRADESLEVAALGLLDLTNGPPPRKVPGLWNLVTFGRAVTNILQNLRKTEPEGAFDQWYEKYRTEMEEDGLMKYFYELRSRILKEGQTNLSGIRLHIRHLEIPKDMSKFGQPPLNAKGFFIGDNLGGTGWEIELPDGSIQKYYVELPPEIGTVNLAFANPPSRHLGQYLTHTSVETLSQLYIRYLSSMLESAKKAFAHG